MPLPLPDLIIEQLNIEIAGPCNFGCVTCPQARINGGREPSFRALMAPEEFRRIVDDAWQYRSASRPFCVSLHGSGEPTLNRFLPEMIAYVSAKEGSYVSFFTHGNLLTPELARRVIASGIDEVTVSLIGYDEETYTRSMVGGDFRRVMEHIRSFKLLADEEVSKAKINTRHLIIDPSRRAWEVQEYQRNIIEPLGVEAEIWLQHNWSGVYDASVSRAEVARRKGITRRSCGRPHANYLEVRAGGLPGRRLAVVACPIVLGRDSQGTLGHLDKQSIAEVVGAPAYDALRKSHEEGAFDDTFCKDCDYLYPDLEEVLVWTNKAGRRVGQSQTAKELIYPETHTS